MDKLSKLDKLIGVTQILLQKVLKVTMKFIIKKNKKNNLKNNYQSLKNCNRIIRKLLSLSTVKIQA